MSGSNYRKFQAIHHLLTTMSKQAGPQGLASQTKLISATPTKCQFEFKVTERDLNIIGILDSGVSATLVDLVTIITLVDSEELDSRTNSKNLGVSTELNISFLDEVKEGETVHFETELIKSGRNINFLNCIGKVKNSEYEKVVVVGRHTVLNV